MIVSKAAQNEMCNALARMVDGGTLELSTSGGDTLAILKLPAPSFGFAIDGQAEVKPVGAGKALKRGTPAHYDFKSSAGEIVMSGNVGEDLEFPSFEADGEVSLERLILRVPASFTEG